VSWRKWEAWADLYGKWIDLYGKEEVRLSLDDLKALYEWFIREAGDRPIEELHIDLLIDPSMTFGVAKKILKSALQKPLTVQEFNALLQERIKQLKEEIEELKK